MAAEEALKESIRKDNLKLKADQKMVIGTGFSMDITEFFAFTKKQEYASPHPD